MRALHLSIGRDASNDLVIEDPSVSSYHAQFVVADISLLLIDCGSTNGTFVRDSGDWQQISQHVLTEYDELRFGDVRMSVREMRRRLGSRLDAFPPLTGGAALPRPQVRCACGAVRSLCLPCSMCGATE